MAKRIISDTDKERIINFGSLGYGPDKMSMLLSSNDDRWTEKELIDLIKDKSSEFAQLYELGNIRIQYALDLKLMELAKSGDMKAMRMFEAKRAAEQ